MKSVYIKLGGQIICPFCKKPLNMEEQDLIDKKLEKSEIIKFSHCNEIPFSVAVGYDGVYHLF